MNIVMVADSFFPDTSGGSHRVMYEQAKNFVFHGHTVYVITPLKKGLKDFDNIDGINVIRYKKRGRVFGFLDYLNVPYNIFVEILNDNKIDLIYGHWPLTSYKIFKKNKQIKKLYFFHGPSFLEYSLEFKEDNNLLKRIFVKWIKHYERKTIKNADDIIVASNYMKNVLNDNFKLHSKVHVIPLACDTEKYHLSKNIDKDKFEINFKNEEYNLLTIRRLRKRMGIDLLIKAMPIILKTKPNVHLYIGGTGNYRQSLEKLVQELNLKKNVSFLGFVPENLIQKYYSVADLFLVPTLDLEGFGLVTLEAFASGTPVVATDVCANSEIVGKFDSKLLCKSNDHIDLGRTIINALDNLNKYSSENCRNYVIKNFSWERNYQDLIGIIYGENN